MSSSQASRKARGKFRLVRGTDRIDAPPRGQVVPDALLASGLRHRKRGRCAGAVLNSTLLKDGVIG